MAKIWTSRDTLICSSRKQWKKDKLLVTCNFFLSHVFKTVLCCVKTSIYVCSEGLPNNKIFDYSKFKAQADAKIIGTPKIKIWVGKNIKHCWKRRKCWLAVFSPFATFFSQVFFFRGVKSQDCVEKGYFC